MDAKFVRYQLLNMTTVRSIQIGALRVRLHRSRAGGCYSIEGGPETMSFRFRQYHADELSIMTSVDELGNFRDALEDAIAYILANHAAETSQDERQCANEKCGKAFVPRHHAQRYCDLGCKHRADSLRAHYRRQQRREMDAQQSA